MTWPRKQRITRACAYTKNRFSLETPSNLARWVWAVFLGQRVYLRAAALRKSRIKTFAVNVPRMCLRPERRWTTHLLKPGLYTQTPTIAVSQRLQPFSECAVGWAKLLRKET